MYLPKHSGMEKTDPSEPEASHGSTMHTVITAVSAMMIPLSLLNLLGGVVSGTLLAILGQWRAIGIGIAYLFVSGIVVSLALMPSMLLAAPAMYCAKKGNSPGMFLFLFLSILYAMALMTFWCMGVLYLFVKMADSKSLVPMLIWSYGVAMAPWIQLARKDQQAGGNEFSLFSTLLAEVAYIPAILMILVANASPDQVFIMFGSIMAVGMIFEFWVALSADKAERETEWPIGHYQ